MFMYLSYLVIKESSEAIKTKNPFHSCFKAMNRFWLNWTMNFCFKQQFYRPKSWASGMFEYWCWLSKSGQKNCVQPQTTGHFFRLCSFEWGSSKLQARCKTQDNKNICEKEQEHLWRRHRVGKLELEALWSHWSFFFPEGGHENKKWVPSTEIISGKLGRIWRLCKKIAATARPQCHWGLLSAILDHKSKMSKTYRRAVLGNKKIINPWTKKQSGSYFYDTIRVLDAKQ